METFLNLYFITTFMVKLSVIVPAYNEEDNIVNTIELIYNTLKSIKDIDYEILVVNDGSSDKTLEKAIHTAKSKPEIKIVSHPFNKGLGSAIKTGFSNTTGDYIILMDADLSYGVEYIPKLFAEITQSKYIDIVTTSPYMPGGFTKNVPFFRLLLSRFGNRIIAYAMSCPLHTVTSMVRIYSRDVIDSVYLDSKGPELQIEILSKAMALGYKVKEIPSLLNGRKLGKSKFIFRRGVSNHLAFSIYEKPMILFGMIGLLTILAGTSLGVYATVLAFQGKLGTGRALVNLIILLITSGIIMFCFGFIANQLVFIKKELYKMQKQQKNMDLHLKKIK